MLKRTSVSLSIIGLGIGIWVIVTSGTGPPDFPPDRLPAINPYHEGIAASGVVEAATRNVKIAAPEPGIVMTVFCEVNDSVKTGSALFQLDSRMLEAELVRAEAAVQVAQSQLKRIQALPRREDVTPLEAALQRVKVKQAQAQKEFGRAKRLREQDAITEMEFSKQDFALQQTDADVAEAQANLDRIRAGAWEPDLKVAESTLQQAKADVQRIRSQLDRLIVRSPVDGIVLKRNVESGEFTNASRGPAIVVGDLSVLHVRAQVDEADAPMLRKGAPATALLTGKNRREFKLRMLRIEPLALPKTQLTRSDAELVDTRVIEVVFELEHGAALYPGQIVDIYIDTTATSTSSGDETAAKRAD